MTPLTGTPARGSIIATATGGPVDVAKRSALIPVITSAAGVAQLAPDRPFRVVAKVDGVTGAGAALEVEAVLGGAAGNLPEGTELRWDPVLPGLEPVAVVGPGGLGGGGGPLTGGPSRIRSARIFEGVGAPELHKALARAQIGGADAYPAVVLSWDRSSGYGAGGGKNDRQRDDLWSIFVIVVRLDSHDARAAEGLDLLDDLEELFVGAEGEPLGILSSPGVEILTRERLASSPSSYVYRIGISTTGAVVRRELRTFAPWLRAALTYPTPTPPAEPVIKVDHKVAMPQG